MVTYYFRTIKDDSLKEISDIRNGVWIHAQSPTENEMAVLVDKLGLDIDILEDANDFFEMPRMERSDGVTYFFTRYPFNEQTEDIETAPLLIVIGDSFVLTVVQRTVPQFEAFFNGKTVIHTTRKTMLFIEIMGVITRSFERQLIGLRRAVNRDRAKLRKIGNQEIVRLVNYEHKLNDMVSALLPTNAALHQIMSGTYMQVFEDDKEMVDDLRIDNMQVVDSARSLLKTIQNVRNAAEAILTNNLNNRIKILTVLTILLTIPTIIASLFGMNVPVPMQENNYGFYFVIATILITVSLAVWYFKQNDWF